MFILIIAIVIAWILIQILKGKRDGFFDTPEQRAKKEKYDQENQQGCAIAIVIFIIGSIAYGVIYLIKG